MIDQTFLKETLLAYGLPCPDGLTEKLDRYAGLLVEWNEKMNLTAITDPEGIAVKHFLDSLQKRIRFLETVCGSLSIPARCVHARAEEAGRMEEYRERFDCASARAVARLRELSEYCLPFVKVGGCFAALKGGDIEEELDEAKYAVRQLGGNRVISSAR